jgi:type IV pilus assembly protein PilP
VNCALAAFQILLLCVLLIACEEEIVHGQALPASTPAASVAASDGGVVEGSAPPNIDFQEAEFSESERSRDPFRSFTDMFVEEARDRVKSQREVVLDQYAIEELKLAGIVTRVVPARAMLVDPTGKGHVVQRGQFVGRSEVVQGGQSGAAYEINWRIDRIRDGDVVLVREDPKNPDVPSATRVLPLRPEGAIAEN